MRRETCDLCRYWDQTEGEQSGLCRAGRPERTADGWGHWPRTGSDDWCAAWREDGEEAGKRRLEHDNFELGSSWAGHAPRDSE